MGASRSQRALVAVDTNVLLDLALEVDDVTDAVEVIRRRLHQPQMLIPPTVREELTAEALHADGFEQKENARRPLDWSPVAEFGSSARRRSQ